jgi:hypothetical protein
MKERAAASHRLAHQQAREKSCIIRAIIVVAMNEDFDDTGRFIGRCLKSTG